jgi:hypothetical protein
MLILPRLWVMLPISHGFTEFFTFFILWHRIYLTLGLMNPSQLEILLCHPVLCRVIVYSCLSFFENPNSAVIVPHTRLSVVWNNLSTICLFSSYVWLCVCIVHGFRIFNLYCHRMSLACVMFRIWKVNLPKDHPCTLKIQNCLACKFWGLFLVSRKICHATVLLFEVRFTLK